MEKLLLRLLISPNAERLHFLRFHISREEGEEPESIRFGYSLISEFWSFARQPIINTRTLNEMLALKETAVF